ncbi:MAG: class I SAM-dependent methyltransferase [Alphaproteobacteria bacterium]|nr:class I SAM-dependent methyltransferase [Alphaproteobacteria bacterium]
MSAAGPRDVDAALDAVATRIARGDLRAVAWHRSNFIGHRRRYAHDLALICALGDASSPVLDVGCAPAHFAAALSGLGRSVVGVDAAPDRVSDLAAAFGIEIRRCDIERERLPWPDGSFRLLVCAETIEHLRVDPLFALSEMNRVLAPDGILLLSTPNLYSLPNILRFMLGRSIADPLSEFAKLRLIGHMGHVREYSTREIVRMLRAFGFAIESVTYDHYGPKHTRRGRIARIAFTVVPRRFRTTQTLLARKRQRLNALDPL